MELIRGLHNLRPRHHGCVATIGNFDGVHLGHQAVLGQLADKAAELHVPGTVITFEPLPREYFARGQAPGRLTRLREKLQALNRYGVDRVLLLRFDAALAALSAAEFVERILVRGLGIRHLVIGDDFRFGRGREGDIDFLRAAGRRHGFGVSPTPSFLVDGCRVSSTRIRELLGKGDLDAAARLLGRPYRLSGRVVHGNKLGRELGFPTANMPFGDYAPPLSGIFVVETWGLPEEPRPGVASLGVRPTIDAQSTQFVLEVHLFDFAGDLYGRHLSVDFLHKLRDEARFDSLEALTEQIARDAEDARAFLARPVSC
ncbi:MAG TPA: bifunctional riboflavin kinase/FAD synthetase [Chromatiales bacterium]|nr:bifunctional riboflavin kinase/FAD synthetase [Chromatiales bacterium]